MVSMLSVSPNAYRPIAAPSTLMGIPMATQNANLRFRNIASNKKTTTPPWIPFSRSIRMRSRTSTLSSPQAISEYPSGTGIFATASWTSSEMLSKSSVLVRSMLIVRAGLPLISLRAAISSNSSRTLEISPTVRITPLGWVTKGNLAMSSPRSRLFLPRKRISWPSLRI